MTSDIGLQTSEFAPRLDGDGSLYTKTYSI